MLSISQFSRVAQIPMKTLRYYDEVGLLKPDYVDAENNYRYYTAKKLEEVFLIKKLRYYEFSIQEIQTLLNGETTLELLLESKQFDLDDKLSKYNQMQDSLKLEREALSAGDLFILKKLDKDVEVVTSKSQNVLFVRREINVKDYSLLMDELYRNLTMNQYTPVGAPYTMYYSLEYNPDKCDTEVGIPVVEETEETRTMASQLCAKYHFVGNYSEIPNIYASLASWIEKNDYDLVDATMEVYLTHPNETDVNENIVDFYFPIKKR